MPDPIQGVNTTGPIGPVDTAGQAGPAAPSDAAAASAAANAAPAVDLANVGQTEALLQTILQAASNVSGIDQAKVAELRQAIASGAYQANPSAIAAKFVELENLLATAGAVR